MQSASTTATTTTSPMNATTSKIDSATAAATTATAAATTAAATTAMTPTTSTMTVEIALDAEREAATMIEDQLDATTSTASRDVARSLLLTIAFQLIRPSRILNSVMSSAMTRLSKTDTARLKITESSNTVMLVQIPVKELIP